MMTEQINHDPAHTFINTGRRMPGHPSMGAWINYGIGSECDNLPGFVILTSPALDMSTPNLMLSYDYFTRLTIASPGDGIKVQITSDVDAPAWFDLATHNTDGGLEWRHQSFTPDHPLDQLPFDVRNWSTIPYEQGRTHNLRSKLAERLNVIT